MKKGKGKREREMPGLCVVASHDVHVLVHKSFGRGMNGVRYSTGDY